MVKYINNTNVCVRRKLTPFVDINLLSTQTNWNLLTQVQVSTSSFGFEYTLMSDFGTLVVWSYGSWSNSRISISDYWSITFWERHEFFHILNLLRYISLKWCVVCPLLDNMSNWFVNIRSLLLIIIFSMILKITRLLDWYIPFHRVQIKRRLRYQIMMWLILF